MRKVWYSVLLAGLMSGCAALEAEISDQPIGLYPIENERGLWGFVNAQGQVAIEPQFIGVGDEPFKHGVAAVEVLTEEGKKHWGLINHNGEWVMPPKYEIIGDFSDNGTAPVVSQDFQEYYIDRRGKQVLTLKEDYEGILPFSEGLAVVEGKNQKYGFIDEQGNLVISPKFDAVSSFSDGLAVVEIGRGFRSVNSYIDRTGRLILPPNLNFVTKFDGGRALVSFQGDRGFSIIDNTGRKIKTFGKYEVMATDSCSSGKGFSQGRIGVSFRNQPDRFLILPSDCGFLDLDGNKVIKAKFDEVKPFSEGLAAVRVRDNGIRKWGFINLQGEMVIEPKFDEVESFKNGLALVSEPPLVPKGYINQQGQYVWKSVEF
jgi:WG containing repeat